MLVDLDLLENNISGAASFFSGKGVHWRPHAKGHKIPAIAHLQLAAGAIGITCAKLGEAEVMAAAGIRSILVSSQVVGPQKATRLANLNRQAEVIAAIDSPENARELDAAARLKGVRIPVVVEVDIGMQRCGVKPGEPVVELAQVTGELAGLKFLGVMGWEGHVRRIRDRCRRRAACEEAVSMLVQSADLCRLRGIPVEIVSCGGTGTEEFSSAVPGVTEFQAGGIIFNDEYYAALGLTNEPALKVISTVISRPDPRRIVTDAGKKTMSNDAAVPRPLGLVGVEAVRFSAEHSAIMLEKPTWEYRVGDRLEWVVGYGDTTICLHDEVFGVRSGIVEVVWPVAGRGKLR
ncbi:MAG: DSD1 family PLP-dependent enzyme [Bacillota bacterium]